MRKWLCIAAAAAVLAVIIYCVQIHHAGNILQLDEKSSSLQHVGLILCEEDDAVIVLAVMQDSPASQCGLQPGDTICSVDHEQVQQISQLEEQLLEHTSNRQTEMTVLRNGEELELELTLRGGSRN